MDVYEPAGAATRRQLLVGGAGAIVAADPLLRAAVRRTRARTPRRPIDQIEHVVILMQENNSFDRYFGTLRGVRGFADPAALTLPGGRSVFHQSYDLAAAGYLLPWHLSIAHSNPCEMLIDNSWKPTHQAVDGGRMDGFASAEGPDAMSYFTRADLPWHMALADAFTVCDGYHCSVQGPTNPNRLYSMTGMIDPLGGHGGPVIDNSQTPAYTWTTYPERLQRAGVSWRVYQQADNFDDNALAWFAQYQQAATSSPLYVNGMLRRDASAFADDIAADRLPRVSWIIGPTNQSEHPGYSPGLGAQFCAQMIGALISHPKVWKKTALFLTYDEAGGYFDHLRPPMPPAGTRGEFVGGLPIGLGLRVPTVVVSPWTRGGYVCSQTFDHTSTLRFLERRFGVREPNISAWRRATCGDLTTCFDFSHRDLSVPSLPAPAPIAAASLDACQHHPPAVPPLLSQQMPGQEPGSRPRRPSRSARAPR
jgi:phospholipase C